MIGQRTDSIRPASMAVHSVTNSSSAMSISGMWNTIRVARFPSRAFMDKSVFMNNSVKVTNYFMAV